MTYLDGKTLVLAIAAVNDGRHPDKHSVLVAQLLSSF